MSIKHLRTPPGTPFVLLLAFPKGPYHFFPTLPIFSIHLKIGCAESGGGAYFSICKKF